MADSDLVVFGIQCPSCEGNLMVRTNGRTGERFLGCAGKGLTSEMGCRWSRNLTTVEILEVFHMVDQGKVGVNLSPWFMRKRQ